MRLAPAATGIAGALTRFATMASGGATEEVSSGISGGWLGKEPREKHLPIAEDAITLTKLSSLRDGRRVCFHAPSAFGDFCFLLVQAVRCLLLLAAHLDRDINPWS